MACTEAYKEHIMYTFNGFCKVVILILSILNEEAAPVVRQIYSLCLAGNGPTKIARMLAEQQIPTPGSLEYRRTGSTRRYHPGYECRRATNTVAHILENREYTGCLVNFKTEKVSYKVKQSKENPVEKQAIFENHHEAIIDRETWERVQELRKQRKRLNRYDEVGLFSGILFCADCGSYKKRTRDCTAHFIRTDLLTAGVTENLRKVTSYAAKHEARFMKLLTEQTEDGSKRRNAARKKELEATANAEKFMKVVRKYTSFEELTPTLLREFVEKIVIHELEALDGKRRGKLRRQEIEIYYSFVGKVELPD